MLKLSKLLGVVAITLLINGCCMTDYSKEIREVAGPMLVELDKYYKIHKRYPNIKERDILLLKSGCDNITTNTCHKNNLNIMITKSITDRFGDI